jgi:diaminopropionate ammonia-lyase
MKRRGSDEDPFAVAGSLIALNGRAGARYLPAMAEVLNDEAFATAAATISGWHNYAPTPLVELPGLAARLGVGRLWFKDEGGRFGLGSFKALGGAYAVARLIAREVERRTGKAPPPAEIGSSAFAEIAASITVTCATDGNHGRSVAWGARLFGAKAVIFIHATVSEGRRAAIAAYGADVRRTGGNYDDSVREAQETAEREGWFVVSDTSYPGYRTVPRDVMQGYEIMAAEAHAALGRLPTHVFLQTGVGGMAAAVAAHLWRIAEREGAPRPKIVLGDPENAACWYETIRAGHPVAVGGDLDTMMAGLACGEISDLAWEILATGCDAAVRLPDAAAIAAMRVLAEGAFGDRPVVAGESAVAGLAALAVATAEAEARAALGLDADSVVLCLGTEGDTDPALYKTIIGRGGDAVRAAATAWRPA